MYSSLPKMNALMREAAAAINIQPHYVGRTQRRLIHSCTDIEGHKVGARRAGRGPHTLIVIACGALATVLTDCHPPDCALQGSDGRLYVRGCCGSVAAARSVLTLSVRAGVQVLDTARVFPPEPPCRVLVGALIMADYGKAVREVRLPMKGWEEQVRTCPRTQCQRLLHTHSNSCVLGLLATHGGIVPASVSSWHCVRVMDQAAKLMQGPYEKVELKHTLSGLIMLRQVTSATPNLRYVHGRGGRKCRRDRVAWYCRTLSASRDCLAPPPRSPATRCCSVVSRRCVCTRCCARAVKRWLTHRRLRLASLATSCACFGRSWLRPTPSPYQATPSPSSASSTRANTTRCAWCPCPCRRVRQALT